MDILNSLVDILSGTIDFLLGYVVFVIQLFLWPVNQLLIKLLPDLSSNIVDFRNGLDVVMNSIGWPLGVLPVTLLTTIIFVFTVRFIVSSGFLSVKYLLKIWNVLQKVKFW